MRLMPQQVDVMVRILNTSTIEELKNAYREAKNGAGEQVRLFFGGKELKDEMTLQDYGIQTEFVVQVFQRA